MLVVTGGTALNYHALLSGAFELPRAPADLDLVGTYDEIMKYARTYRVNVCYPINSGKSMFMKVGKNIIEAEIAWPGSRAEKLLQFVDMQRDNEMPPFGFTVPSLDVLYLLKCSHKYLKDSPHFLKTMEDIYFMRDKLGCKIRPEHVEFLKQREKDTYTNKLPSLKRSKADFFSGDGIVYDWDHDSLHEALKVTSKPAYQYFSGGEVWSDIDLFENLPERIKLYAVLEESMVLAAERSQLAFPDMAIDPKWSFDKALEKVCTSITGGRFREYAWNNYYRVQELYDEVGSGYMDRVQEGIRNDVVRRAWEH